MRKKMINKYSKEGHNYRGSRDSNDNKRIVSITLWQYIWKLRQNRHILREI